MTTQSPDATEQVKRFERRLLNLGGLLLLQEFRALSALPSNATTNTLYDAIKHGDDDHKAWLREAIDAHFAGQPVPAPRGLGNKERRIAELEAQLAVSNATTNASLVEALEGLLSIIRPGQRVKHPNEVINASNALATLHASNPDEEGK